MANTASNSFSNCTKELILNQWACFIYHKQRSMLWKSEFPMADSLPEVNMLRKHYNLIIQYFLNDALIRCNKDTMFTMLPTWFIACVICLQYFQTSLAAFTIITSLSVNFWKNLSLQQMASLPHTVYQYCLNSSVDALEVPAKMSPWNAYPLLSNGNIYPYYFPYRYCTLNI